ncbi:MAG: hypothetical protein WC426_14055 [Sulfuriferula sp.]
MSPNNEYQIPNTAYAEFPVGEVVDIPRATRPGLDSVEVGIARQAVFGSFGEFSPTPEQQLVRKEIAKYSDDIDNARRYELDSRFVERRSQ